MALFEQGPLRPPSGVADVSQAKRQVLYRPDSFPPDERLDWSMLIPIIGPAVEAVARYDGVLSAIPNPNVLLSPLTTQEAVVSSRIEGTQATMNEVLEFEAGREVESLDRRTEMQEVLNYRAAMREAERLLRDLPLCLRVIRQVHGVLLSGVRGQDKSPGEFRDGQNWIGAPGCELHEADYVPPNAGQIADSLAVWESYAHLDGGDRLVRLAILHAEFEALHPFWDGNGRLGRMLVPLFLWQRGMIQHPMFYISAYFESKRDTYYEKLRAVSRDDNWTSWSKFFLEAVRVQAEDNLNKANGILNLYEQMKRTVVESTRSQYAVHALDWIFQYPIFFGSTFVASAEIPRATARRILNVLREAGILRIVVAGSGRRSTLYSFDELLNTAEGQEVF